MIGEQQFPFLAEKGHVVSLVGYGGRYNHDESIA